MENKKSYTVTDIAFLTCFVCSTLWARARGIALAVEDISARASTGAKLEQKKEFVCSSDIIESSFGKYKEVVKANKSIGVSDICLSISCLTNTGDLQVLKKSLESIKMDDIEKWKNENIRESLFKKRTVLYKENGTNKKIKIAA